MISMICGYSSNYIGRRGNKLVPSPKENGAGRGLSSVLEADVKNIVRMAKETFEK